MNRELNEALWMKLLEAQSAQQAVEILRANGEDCTAEDAPHLWREIESIKEDMKQAEKEEAVFMQQVSPEELESAAGGKNMQDGDYRCSVIFGNPGAKKLRSIYGGNGFANCAATVESGSWCGTNDACYSKEIRYCDMKSCAKAWE